MSIKRLADARQMRGQFPDRRRSTGTTVVGPLVWTAPGVTVWTPACLHQPPFPGLLETMAESDALVFMMGQFPARIPADRRYSASHLWLRPVGDLWRVGFTAYSVRLLQDVYFLNWSIDPDTPVRAKQEMGEIESSKAVSSLYAPCEGRVVRFNEKVASDPTAINTDNYDTGWLYELETQAPLLDAREYLAVLEAGWEQTQRMIKGQMNE